MPTSNDYINRAKKALRIEHDTILADYLGMRQSSVAAARRRGLTDPMAVRIAEIAGVDPGEVLIVAKAERERDVSIKAHLMAFAKKVVAPLGVVLVVSGHPSKSDANEVAARQVNESVPLWALLIELARRISARGGKRGIQNARIPDTLLALGWYFSRPAEVAAS